jgi:hypothetical protein
MSDPVVKRDWKNLVLESDGTMFMLPEELLTRAKEWNNKREAFQEKLEEMSRAEIEISNSLENILFDMRKHLADNGIKSWQKEIGFEATALVDGEYVITLTKPMGR